MHRYTLLLLSLALSTSCARHAEPGAVAPRNDAAAPTEVADPARGFAIAVPHDMQVRHDFRRSYLSDAHWKAFAADASPGTPVLALVLQGSDAVTAAELRIGVGDDEAARAHCLDTPSGSLPDGVRVTLAGVPFVRFHAADAAMSHYMDAEAYRAVHDGRCYAIDLLVTGTRPEVYDPPATPPFTRGHALARLRQALAGLRFDR